MTLGEIIKNYRDRHEMSMDAFSAKSGISKAYISLLEKNKHPKTGKPITPSIQSIKQAADGMDMDFNVLFNAIDGDVSLSATDLSSNTTSLSPDEESVIDGYRKLNDAGKKKVHEYIDDLTENVRYTYEPTLLAAHKRTDIEPDPEGDAADIALVMKLAKESNGGS